MGVIRLLLALSVVVGHMGGVFGYTLVDPAVAVEVFFIISGFYMAMILSEKYNSYSLFITNRFLKIYPAYLVVLLVTFVLSTIYLVATHNYENGIVGKIISAQQKVPASALIPMVLSNLTIFGQDVLFFFRVDGHSNVSFTTNYQNSNFVLIRLLAVPQAWSIALELMFYLIAPFLNKLKTLPLLLIGAASLCLKITLYRSGLTNDPWTYRFFPSELFFFILGILSYRLYKTSFFTAVDSKLNHRWTNILYISFLLVFFLFSPGLNSIQSALFIAAFTFLLPFIFEKFRKVRLDKKIGDFSYELYIAHELCIYSMTNIISRFSHHTEINKILVLIGSLVFSYALSILVTQKIDRFRQNRIKKSVQPVAGTLALETA